eukprot:292751-Pelagomonas_calceolata.AAC.4
MLIALALLACWTQARCSPGFYFMIMIKSKLNYQHANLLTLLRALDTAPLYFSASTTAASTPVKLSTFRLRRFRLSSKLGTSMRSADSRKCSRCGQENTPRLGGKYAVRVHSAACQDT